MRPPPQASNPICRIGFVGTGGVATRHADVLSGFSDVALVAATDVDPARAESFAQRFGMAVADGVDGLLGHDLHAVYVCVPPFAHGPAESSAEARVGDAGVALFVEKPLAADLATAEDVGARLDRAGVVTRVGHHWRCAEPVARARELLAGRTPRLVTAAWWDKVPPVAWWPHRARSGGPVVEQAVHVLDLARVLVGEVDEVHARSSGTVPGGDVDATTAALLSFANGAVGTLSTASVLGWKHRAGVEVVADGLVVGVGEDWLEVRDGTAEPQRYTYDRMSACVAADRTFVDAVAGRPVDPDRCLPDHAEALRTHRLATAVVRSAASGAPEAGRMSGDPGADHALVVERPGHAVVRPVAAAQGPVAVRTRFTGLSAGTEISFLTGTNPALTSSFDPELGLFRADLSGAGYPVERLGYMEVAEVTEAPGDLAFTVGDTVAMTYGHRTGYRADPLRDRIVPLPPDIDPLLGIYVAHMGPICANGLLHAAVEEVGRDVRSLGDGVRGRRVSVVGGGVVGLLTGLLARHHGAEEVVVLDPTPLRRAAAEGLGLTALDPDAADPALALKARWRRGAGDRGADVVFQCRGRSAALALALRLLRPQGTVIDLAFYTDDGAALRLGEEFHHNGLGVRTAQIGRVPRGTAHAWDRERLSAETIALLRAHGSAVREHVVTDVVPLAEGPALLADLAARRRHVIQAVLTCE